MNGANPFLEEVRRNIEGLKNDRELKDLSRLWLRSSAKHRYSYNFTWMGRPIIQYPQDVLALQEIVWSVQPDLIIETGIAHGGSLVFHASLLELIGRGEVIGIDIEIRPHNREAIEQHPMFRRIRMIEGSSTAPQIVDEVQRLARGHRVLVVLDSNHTHAHVLAELEAYAPLVAPGSYCVVMDTIIESLPADAFPDRPWGKGNNPWTAVHAYLEADDRFEIDTEIQDKLLVTVAPDGYLKRIR